MTVKVYVIGPNGSYSDRAAQKYITEPNKEGTYTVEYVATARDAYEAVISSDQAYAIAIIPYQNSVTGEIKSNKDMIDIGISCGKLKTISTIGLPIDHVLASKPAKAAAILDTREVTIYSHIQALFQCSGYIEKSYPEATLKPCTSTSQAASIVNHLGDDHNAAAICSASTAQQQKLTIIEENIVPMLNVTTFAVLGNTANVQSNNTLPLNTNGH